MDDLTDRVAVITGAGSGFGREFARLARRRGMKLVLADVQDDALAAVVAELALPADRVIAERVDVARSDEVERLAARAFGAVDIPRGEYLRRLGEAIALPVSF